jgi:hypothetical protein
MFSKQTFKPKYLIVFLFWMLTSCYTPQKQDSPEVPKYTESNQIIGCKGILDSYCNQLYSPTASGNLEIDRHLPIQILQGETKNQFPQVFYKYSLAKIKQKTRLPADFLSILNKYSYFERLDEFIHRPPIQKMSLEERLNTEHLNIELDGIWQSAIEQTVLTRMSNKFKGYHQISSRLMPIEYELEQRRIRRNLISEFSKILWKDDNNWKKVMIGFNDLKKSFLILFDELDIPNKVREDWKNKIETLQLKLPGSLPEISDEECSTTTINAYYYKSLNILTVCAGDFNSEDILFTLAHEMSHSLGIDRDLYIYLQKSELGINLKKLRNNVCEKKPELSCEDWANFKKEVQDKANEISKYEPPLLEFNRCLKKASDTKKITDEDIDRIANKIIKNRIASFASSNLYLRLIKNKLPMKNGKMEINPNFMNPCSYYLWSKNDEPIDDEIYSLIYFAAEYKCNKTDSEQIKLQSSINISEGISIMIEKAILKSEGEFSDRPELTSEGFSSPPFERSADVIGTYAVAEFLKKYDTRWERRTKYLASNSWLCQEPSLESKYPEESKIEQLFNTDSHSETEDRKKEILSEPIRESLSCEKDFTFNECILPFKQLKK